MFGGTKQSKRRKRNNKQTNNKQTKKNQRLAATAPAIETHRFISSMTFDGNTLTTQTQKDDEPVIRHRYTKEQLAREIPIGNEMVEQYLDGKMPKELQAHYHEDSKRPMFTNVLVSPADLGLLPPRELHQPNIEMSRRQRRRRGRRQRSKNERE